MLRAEIIKYIKYNRNNWGLLSTQRCPKIFFILVRYYVIFYFVIKIPNNSEH